MTINGDESHVNYRRRDSHLIPYSVSRNNRIKPICQRSRLAFRFSRKFRVNGEGSDADAGAKMPASAAARGGIEIARGSPFAASGAFEKMPASSDAGQARDSVLPKQASAATDE